MVQDVTLSKVLFCATREMLIIC